MKSMKKFFFTFFSLIIVVSIFLILMQFTQLISLPGLNLFRKSEGSETGKIGILQKAFESTGAAAVSSEVYIAGMDGGVGTALNDEESRKRMIAELIASTGYADGYSAGDSAGHIADGIARDDSEDARPVFSRIDNDNSYGMTSDYAFNENAGIHISLLKYLQDNPAGNYTASVSLTDTSGKPDLKAAAAGLLGIFEKYGIDPDINICITGSLEGKLKEEELESICAKVFEVTGAGGVEGIRDGGLISVSAFAPSIKDSVKVNGKDINLNIAIRYNSYEEKTYIWLATPIITTEY